ncbi:MAG: hypothetical protein D6698_16245, partial [Gammaproteobacteria bacterium]
MTIKIKDELDLGGMFFLGSMTTAERTALTPERAGALVFDSTDKAPYLYDGTTWHKISPTVSTLGVSSNSYNALKNGSDGKAFYLKASQHVKWSTSSHTTAYPAYVMEPQLYEYTGSSNTTLYISRPSGVRYSSARTYFFYVLNSGSGTVSISTVSGVNVDRNFSDHRDLSPG